MGENLHSKLRLTTMAAAIVAATLGHHVAAQTCAGGVAQAVQVKFIGCGQLPDEVVVHEGDSSGSALALTKAANGYWEADRKTFDPGRLRLCSACSSPSGCAFSSEVARIDRNGKRPCAARYFIECNEPVWKLNVETKPGRTILHLRRLKLTSDRTPKPAAATPPATPRFFTPVELCDLALDEMVEPKLELAGISVPIPLRPITVASFQKGPVVEISRSELARGLKDVLGSKRVLSDEERELLPRVVTFRMN